MQIDFADEDEFDCSTQINREPTCEIFQGETILIKGVFGSTFIAGQNFNLTLFNMKVYVRDKGTTDPLELTTHTSEGYKIDQIETGLSFYFECNYPCLTCDSNDPNACNSCNDISG